MGFSPAAQRATLLLLLATPCAAGARSSDFVGVGIRPDRVVSPTVADVRAGRDAALQAALRSQREK